MRCFRRNAVERDLREELQSHLELLAEEHMKRGLPADEAWRAARRDFGGLEQAKERIRDQPGLPMMDAVIQAVRYAVRLLMKARGFTAVAVLTLALGIGANGAVFSVVHAVMLQPLAYPESRRLVSIYEHLIAAPPAQWSSSGRALGVGPTTPPEPERVKVAVANLRDLRQAVGSVAIGAAAGLAGACAFSRHLTNLLFDVHSTDLSSLRRGDHAALDGGPIRELCRCPASRLGRPHGGAAVRVAINGSRQDVLLQVRRRTGSSVPSPAECRSARACEWLLCVLHFGDPP